MSELQRIIQINNNFQKSINLQFDLGNEDKVGNYISTESSDLIEKKYLDAIENKALGRATIIVGPYGKGKSHLLLEMLSKLSVLDKPFLPIIISANSSLVNAFKIALKNALERNNITDIVVDSYYKEAIKIISKWKKEYHQTYDKFLIEIDSDEKKFINELKKNNEKSLIKFKKIYSKLTSGNEFNPLIQEDVVSIYNQVTNSLCDKYGYSGIFIVFDEFSKFIEGHVKEGFAADMRLLQEMCELANRSDNKQIHITFVAHKSIKEYGNRIDRDVINEFRGVEGRLREIRYVVSSRNNFEVISKVIYKDKEKLSYYLRNHKDYNLYKEILDDSFTSKVFSNIFEKNKYKEIMGIGCYPLTPISVCILSSISEKVAQNERSIFTFLSGNEGHSLIDIIKADKTDRIFVGSDAIYDYFENIFRSEHDNLLIHNEWLRADYALHQTDILAEQKVIKAISLLCMCNGSDELIANNLNIRLSLGISTEELEAALDGLKDKNIIVWRNRTKSYNFKINIGLDLENEIRKIAFTKYANVDECVVIRKVTDIEFILPKRYNQEFTMTRFFSFEYMNEDTFMNLNTTKHLFDEKFSDGKIIVLVSGNVIDADKVKNKLMLLNDERVVVLCSEYTFIGYSYAKKYLAVNELLNNNEFIENNKALIQELELYIHDLSYELNELIKYNFMPEYKRAKILHLSNVNEEVYSEVGFNRFLSRICENYYNKAPKINNEMINKNTISTPIKKSRGKLINEILENVDMSKYDKGTSPEATIYRSIIKGIDEEGTVNMISNIRTFISNCDGKRNSFDELFDILQGESIGARRGAIPIYLAMEMTGKKDTMVIYYHDAEVVVDSNTLNNICDKPKEYSLYIEKGSIEKEQYLSELYSIFGGNAKDYEILRYDKMSVILDLIQKWFRGLSQYTISCDFASRKIDKYRKILKRIEINPRDFLFEEIPKIFDKDCNYIKIAKELCKVKNLLDNHLNKVFFELSNITKKIFGGNDKDDLLRVLKNWESSASKLAMNSVVSQNTKQFINWIAAASSHDDSALVSECSRIVIGMYVENWDDGSKDKYEAALMEIKQEIADIDTKEENKKNKIVFTDSNGNIVEKFYNKPEEDGIGDYLINAVEEIINEFGDSLETNEKVSIMIKILEDMLK